MQGDLLVDTFVLALCGAFGQVFIYLTVSLHDGYKVSIFTTARKCFSVVFSAYVFRH